MIDRILLGIAVVILIFNFLINDWVFHEKPDYGGTFVALMIMSVVIGRNLNFNKK